MKKDPADPARQSWHSATWWTGVGGILAAVAIVIALGQWLFPITQAEPSAAATSSSPSPP